MRAGRELAGTCDGRVNPVKSFGAGKGASALGATEDTRFGVIAERTGDLVAPAQLLVDTQVDLTIRAFAYSP